MTSKFGGSCSRCKLGIKKGEQIFYYPANRTVLCAGDGCGKQAERDLQADDFDQAMYSYQG
jgi:hypothetical protein